MVILKHKAILRRDLQYRSLIDGEINEAIGLRMAYRRDIRRDRECLMSTHQIRNDASVLEGHVVMLLFGNENLLRQ